MATTTFTPTQNSDGTGAVTNVPSLPSPSLSSQGITPTGAPNSNQNIIATPNDLKPGSSQNAPIIPANTLAGGNGTTSSLNIPQAGNSAQTAAAGVIGGSAGLNNTINASQQALLDQANSSEGNAQGNYDSMLSHQEGLINQYLGKGADQLQQMNQAGVFGLQSTSNSLTAQYNAQSAAYTEQYNQIMLGSGSMEQKQAQISDLQIQHGTQLAATAAQQAIAQSSYTNAMNIINQSIDIKYGTLKDAIDYGQTFLAQNKDILTAQQQNQFNAKLAVQQQQYTQGVYYDQLNANTGVDMIKTAAENGADQATLDAMGQAVTSGASFGDVASMSNGYLTTNNYTPIQTGINYDNGLPIYSSFNPKTGQMEPLNYNDAHGTSGSTSTIVNGYQFGASTTMGAYASNTTTQVNNINAAVSKIANNVGAITDDTSAQAAIDTVTKGSPITGDMVMVAAKQYGVDPATLIGVMQAETQCGTDGSTGAKECNWGNVGNTDALMAAGKSVKMTPQQGVNAIANNLAKRKVQGDQIDPTQSTGTTALSPMQQGQVLKSSAPTLIQPAVQLTKNGSAYIDISKVAPNMQTVATAWSQKTGTPILNSDQVGKVNQIETAIAHITEIIAPDYAQIAPSNTFDSVAKREQALGATLGNTDYKAQLVAFQENRETVAQQIAAISGGSADDATIKTAEDALPDAFDNLKQGNTKLKKSLDILNSNLQTYLPNANLYSLNNGSQAAPAAGTIQQIGTHKIKINADGSATVIQ